MKLNKMLGKISLLVALVFPIAANSTIIMIDNTDAGFSSSGFITSTARCCVGSAIGTNYMTNQAGSQGNFAIWDASGDADWVAGTWQVEMNWTSYFNRASNTLVTIGSALDTLFVDQTINGGTWQDLGQFNFVDSGSFVKNQWGQRR
jgi:hypothetical protein